MIQLAVLQSPIGPLTVAASEHRVCLLHFGDDQAAARGSLARWYPMVGVEWSDDPAGAVTALNEYFDGDLTAPDRLEVEMNGTAFQQLVWAALRGVKAGQTASYGEVANRIGSPSAVRAVGAANGANPIAIIVPCHRIVGANGTLTGYGGGLERKEWLLRHERARLL